MTFSHENELASKPASAQGARDTRLPIVRRKAINSTRSRSRQIGNEERYAALMRVTGQLVWTSLPDGSVMEARCWCAFTGLTVEQVKGWAWLDAVHPDDREHTERRWKQEVMGEKSFEMKYRVRRYDGTYGWFAVRSTPVWNAAGNISEWVSAATIDHVEIGQHLKEQQMVELTSQLEDIFDAMPEAVVVFDEVGTVLHDNIADRVLFGFDATAAGPPRSLHERGKWLAMRDEHGSLPEHQWPAFRILRGETLHESEAVELKEQSLDGREIEVSEYGVPIRNKSEHIIGGVLVVRDITRKWKLERRTRETLQSLLGMVSVIAELTTPTLPPTELETSLIIQHLGQLACSMLGCTRLSIMAQEQETEYLKPLLHAGWPIEVEQWWSAQGNKFRLESCFPGALLERLRAGEVVVNDPAAKSAKDCAGQEPGHVLLAPLHIGSQFIGALILGYDEQTHQYSPDECQLAGAVAQLAAVVIERARLLHEREDARSNEMASREAMQRMELFMAMASHEIRAPLAVIKHYLQLAENQLDNARPYTESTVPLARALQSAQESLDQTSRAVLQMSSLLDDFLQVWRAHTGKLVVRPQLCELCSIVQARMDEQQRINPTRHLHLRLPESSRVNVIADPERIGQVVTNYITNATKFSAEDRTVEVGVEVGEHTARVFVRDHGPGLSRTEQKRIWRSFYQATGEQRPPDTNAGLGLGLYICKTIIEQHQGEVGVESSVGSGSTFWFTLPTQQ